MADAMKSYDKFLSGDKTGMLELIEAYRDGLILFLNTYVHDLDRAEDLAEDVFAKLVVKKPKFKGESAFSTWLYAIARNIALDSLSHDNRRVSAAPEDIEHISDSEADAAELYLQGERKAIVHRALGRINAEYRQVIYLSYFEGFSNTEIAAILKKSRRQVEQLLYRAKSALKQELEKEGFGSEDL